MKKLLFVLILISYNSLFSQELTKLFLKDLPDRAAYESFVRRAINTDLELAAKIHPEMLYYYIVYSHGIYNGKVESGYSISSDQLGEARSSYIKRRNAWFMLQEKYLHENEKDSSKLDNEIDYISKQNQFKNYNIKSICDNCYKTDKNKQEYIVYKYYMNDPSLIYLPNENYTVLRKEYEKALLDEYNSNAAKMYSNDLSEGNAKSALSKMLDHWYLFEGSDSTSVLPASFTISLVKEYFVKRRPKNKTNTTAADNTPEPPAWIDQLGVNLYIASYKLPFEYDLEMSNHLPASEFKFDTPSIQLYLGINYTYRIKKENGIFSKAIIETGAGFGKLNRLCKFTYAATAPADAFNGEYIVADMQPTYNFIRLYGFFDFSLKVSTPLFFIGSNFSLGIGGGLNYLVFLEERQFKYFHQTLKYTDGKVSATETGYVRVKNENSTTSLFDILPLLKLDYKLTDRIGLCGEISYNYFAAGISF